MSDLFVAGCSIAPTRRRRFLWAAWWTAPPSRVPFRKPDAFHGGAKTREEARQAAERAAGVPLAELEPRWARAWARVLLGQPPWREKAADSGTHARHEAAARHPKERPRASVWAILGVTREATLAELKAAFRKRVLETHPDQGGDAEAFRDVQRAYEEALRRSAKRGARVRR